MSLEETHIKKLITSKWDESAVTFDSQYGHKVKTQEEAKAWIGLFKKVIPKGELKVLDVGCGTGELSVLFAEMGHEVIGIDLSEKMMEKGREKSISQGLGIKFMNGDAEEPLFDEGSFDVLVTRHLLWTLPNPEKAVRNWNKVLKDGGCVLVIDGIWDDGSLNTRVRRFLSNIGVLIFERRNPWKEHNYSQELRSSLPNVDGTSLDISIQYLNDAGFVGLKHYDISNIRKIQKQQMPFWKRIGYNYDYYLLYGQK
jgi:ubiquinone/menaquinone biosynthesis C-methylase UbiE